MLTFRAPVPSLICGPTAMTIQLQPKVTPQAFTDHGLPSVHQVPHISCHVYLVAYMVCMSQVTLLWAANPNSRATHRRVIGQYITLYSTDLLSVQCPVQGVLVRTSHSPQPGAQGGH